MRDSWVPAGSSSASLTPLTEPDIMLTCWVCWLRYSWKSFTKSSVSGFSSPIEINGSKCPTLKNVFFICATVATTNMEEPRSQNESKKLIIYLKYYANETNQNWKLSCASANRFPRMHTNLIEDNLPDKCGQFCLFAWISPFVPFQTQRCDNPGNEWLTSRKSARSDVWSVAPTHLSSSSSCCYQSYVRYTANVSLSGRKHLSQQHAQHARYLHHLCATD